MAYTIKGLAKANECESYDMSGLANLWDYWLICNNNDEQSVKDFKRLRKADRKVMMAFLRDEYPALANHILPHVDL